MNRRDFIAQKHIQTRIREFRPTARRVIDSPIKVPSRNARALIGTAFDYLLRFEIGRRTPVAKDRWIADQIENGVWWRASAAQMRDGLRQFCESHPDFRVDDLDGAEEYTRYASIDGIVVRGSVTDPYEIYFIRAVRKVVNEARAAVVEYRAKQNPSVGEQKEAAFHALRLAKIDLTFRIRWIDPTFECAAREAIDELAQLLGVVPWDDFPVGESPILNPTLGAFGIGADADLICSGCLIDIKTTADRSMNLDWLDQLLVYYIFSRHHRRNDPGFPDVTRLGLYFARHGQFWCRDAQEWSDRPGFAEFEQWFLDQTPGRQLDKLVASPWPGGSPAQSGTGLEPDAIDPTDRDRIP